MARAQFDRDDVVNRSVQLFWQRGFNGASMQEVVKATSLKPGSIYLAFGSKEGLFREALEQYAASSISWLSATMESAESVGHGLCAILKDVVASAGEADYCSCFLIKTQLELAPGKGALYELASDKLKEVESIYEAYIERAYGKEKSAARAASMMMHIFGIRVYGYKLDSSDRMMQGLYEGLPWLPWAES